MKDLVEKLQREKQMKELGIESTDEGFSIKVPARTLRGKNYNFIKTVTYKSRQRMSHDDIVKSLLSYEEETKKHPDCIRYEEYIQNKNKGRGVPRKASMTGVQYLSLSYNKNNNKYRLSFICPNKENSKGCIIDNTSIEKVLKTLDELKHDVLGTDRLTEKEFDDAVKTIRQHYEHHVKHGKWKSKE